MNDIILIFPEVFLALTLVFVVVGEISYSGEAVRLVFPTALVGLSLSFAQSILSYQLKVPQGFGGSISVDGFALFFKLLFIALSALTLVSAFQSDEIPPSRRTEYTALILASTLAMCLAASATDMILAVVCIQAVNVCCYFLAGYNKQSVRSVEAAVKFMVFAVVALGLLLYGLAILFGATHSLNIYEIHRALISNPLTRNEGLVVFGLIFLALSFQIAAFPMHLSTPDVLEGSPTPSSSFLSVGVRAMGFAVVTRFFLTVFAKPAASGTWEVLGLFDWIPMIALVSGVTMLGGSLLALRQKGAKRMVACLVVAETGFFLIGFLVLDQVGIAALLYNLLIELFALVGIFYVLSFFVNELKSDQLSDLRGIVRKAVPECVCLVIFLLSLVGLPPLPGFIGKFTLIGVAIRHKQLVLAMIAILATGISTVVIARMSHALVGDFRKGTHGVGTPALQGRGSEPTGSPLGYKRGGGQSQGLLTMSPSRRIFLGVLLVPTLLLGVFAQFFLDWASKSLGFILQ